MTLSRAERRVGRYQSLFLPGLAMLCAVPSWRAVAGSGTDVIQQGRAFNMAQLHVRAGDTVHFLNQDEFDHQIFVQSPIFNVDTDEASPGAKTDVRFTDKGTFAVRCHIHPRMHLTVIVD